MKKVLAEVVRLPEPEQDILAGLMLTYFFRKEAHLKAQVYNTKLWTRLRDEDPEYVRDYNRGQKRNAEKAKHFIGLILLVDWDPIGVLGIPAAEREYARYVLGVHELLLSYPTVEVVADYLYIIERETMELGRKKSARQTARQAVLMQVAQKLVDLSKSWKLEAIPEELPI